MTLEFHPKHSSWEELQAALKGIRKETEIAKNVKGPALPPAEYKPLLEGTKVRYDNWEYTVTRSDGFETVVKTNLRKWIKTFGVFGRQGDLMYSLFTLTAQGSAAIAIWETDFGEKTKSALKSLWPLTIGKKVNMEFEETYDSVMASDNRTWRLTLEVAGTEFLELNGARYPTFVIRSHASSEKPDLQYVETQAYEYSETY